MKIPFAKEKKRLFFDGATGTVLQSLGLGPGEAPELWNLEHPERVKALHKAYFAAGADVVKTNTFGANRLKLQRLGKNADAGKVIRRGVELAKEAAAEAGGGLVAMDVGPTGRLLEPMGDLGFEEAVSVFREMISAGCGAGADLILIETMTDLYEAKAALLAAKETTDLPVFVTMTFDARGRLLTGGDVATAAVTLEGLGAAAVGMNCGVGPDVIPPLLKTMRAYTALPLIANPNAGLPLTEGGRLFYDVGPEEFARAMTCAAEAGAAILGGCCGTTPEHIARLIRETEGLPLPAEIDAGPAAVSSGVRTAVFGESPVIVGGRMDPAGNGEIRQALEEDDVDTLIDEAMGEEEDGADVLGVGAGAPGTSGADAAADVIRELQSVVPLPFLIGAGDPAILEKAMRIYNGKPLLGPVKAEKESMEAIFPLIRKYGGAAVCLTAGKEGMPRTAEERLEKARELLRAAASYGIMKKDLLIDPVGPDGKGGEEEKREALRAIALVKKELGAPTVLGALFGGEGAAGADADFLASARKAGLDAAVLDPGDGAAEAFRADA